MFDCATRAPMRSAYRALTPLTKDNTMSHNIDTSTGRAAIAFRGADPWHKLGQKAEADWTPEQWRIASGTNFHVDKLPAYINIDGEFRRVEGQYHLVRDDTHHVLSPRTVSKVYKTVQSADIDAWFSQYISVDDRFQMDVKGALNQGEIIWATAVFNGGMTVAGADHVARLLMTTSFDLSMPTVNQGTMVKVVCANTMATAMSDKNKSFVRTRHNAHFDPVQVGKELAQVVSGFAAYKAMGEAMAQKHLAGEQVSNLFKYLLDIPFDCHDMKQVSTRKANQFDSLRQSYAQTVNEENGTHRGTAWAALNAVTRYVDHERSSRGGDDKGEARFVSAQFGSGAALKAKAVTYLDNICGGDLLRAVAAKTADDADVSAMLKQAFKPTVIA